MPITAASQPTNIPPRVQLTVSGLTDATTTILRNDPDGRSRAVRGAEPLTLTGGGGVALDYEAPLGSPVTYTSAPPVNAAETSGPVTVDSLDVWLIHPGVPDLSVRVPAVNVTALQERTRAARAAVMQPPGRSTPVVVSEVRSSTTGGITVITETFADRDAMWALLELGITLLLNAPATLGWGVTWEYISVGDVTEDYLSRGLNAARLFSLPYTVVDRPAGALVTQWAYGDVTTYSTYTAVLAAYPTYTSLLANTPT